MYSVNHPMHCLSFLLALKAHLDVEVEVEVDVQDVVKKSAKNKLSQNEKDNKNKTKSIPSKISKTGVVGRRTEGLHLMTTLALTYAHMSRKTVLALEVRTDLHLLICVRITRFSTFCLFKKRITIREDFLFIFLFLCSYSF